LFKEAAWRTAPFIERRRAAGRAEMRPLAPGRLPPGRRLPFQEVVSPHGTFYRGDVAGAREASAEVAARRPAHVQRSEWGTPTPSAPEPSSRIPGPECPFMGKSRARMARQVPLGLRSRDPADSPTARVTAGRRFAGAAQAPSVRNARGFCGAAVP
jgi:hypothetical protein